MLVLHDKTPLIKFHSMLPTAVGGFFTVLVMNFQ